LSKAQQLYINGVIDNFSSALNVFQLSLANLESKYIQLEDELNELKNNREK